MRKILISSLMALTAGCAAEPPLEGVSSSTEAEAAALAGWVPDGPPQRCVPQRDLAGNESIGENAILFRGATSSRAYVNRPPAGCPRIGVGRALKVRTTQTQICAGDIVEVFDPVNNVSGGGCGLGDFQPYRRAR